MSGTMDDAIDYGSDGTQNEERFLDDVTVHNDIHTTQIPWRIVHAVRGLSSDTPQILRDYIKAMFWVSFYSLTMMLSFTISFSFVALTLFIPRVAELEDGDIEDYRAAVPLIVNVLQVVGLLYLSALYGMNLSGSELVGQKIKLQNFIANRNEYLKSEAWNKINKPKTKEQLEEDLRQTFLSIRNIFRSGLIYGFPVMILGFLTLFFSGDILHLIFQQDAKVSAIAGDYLRIQAYAFPLFTLRMVLEQMLFSYGKNLAAMVPALTSFIVCTALAWVLGLGPAKLGIEGLSLAYLIDTVITCLSYLLFTMFLKDFRAANLYFSLDWGLETLKMFYTFLKDGLTFTLFYVAELIITLLLAMLAGWLGTDALAIYSFPTQLTFFTVIGIIAFGQSTTQFVLREKGANNYEYATRIARGGLAVILGFITVVATLFIAKPAWLIKTNSERDLSNEDYHDAEKVIRIAAAGTWATAATYNMVQVLRGTEQKWIPLLLTVACGLLGLALAYVLAFPVGMGIVGSQLASTACALLGALLLLPYWLWYTRTQHFINLNDPNAKTWGLAHLLSKTKQCLFCQSGENESDEARTPLVSVRGSPYESTDAAIIPVDCDPEYAASGTETESECPSAGF